MECSQIDLYEFLTESELQHYYNAIKNELKITNAAQFKYATDEDLKNIGLSRPEIRRLRKFYEKHFPHGYLSKIKRLLQTPTALVKREDGTSTLLQSPVQTADSPTSTKSASSPSKAPNNKHIIPADSISVNKQLGTGEFGIVQQGVWTNGNERIQVAIKCLCRERMQSNPMEFLKEAAIMHSIEHENIVRLYGVVLATDSLMLVTELAHLRSLLECLKDSDLRVSFLTVPTLCEFAIQICNGMRYLENKRLIHRDLAARNILVFSKNKVKISDFGLSRALGVGKDYYKTNFNVNLKLPIAWCAPECINYLRFTNASDVWAYGVCLWEMFSYGFQPWAALTGLQILEAIDAPNYQRLEQPDCCPRDYYTLMLKCWQDEPVKRPKFSEIYEILPDIKPEQLKAVVNYMETKKDHLLYRQGEIITVLDRSTGNNYWKGVLVSGKTGFFNPSNTVAYLEGLPSYNRDSFCRISERSSKRKLRTEMISKPQNDFKHTGHVGIDGESFGDIAFLGNSQNYNHVPRQIVTPYKPSEDIEQTPLLLPPTPTSPDTASGYFSEGMNATSVNPNFISSNENTPKYFSNTGQSFEFPGQQPADINASTNPFKNEMDINKSNAFTSSTKQHENYARNSKGFKNLTLLSDNLDDMNNGSGVGEIDSHEYHEISDDEIATDKLDLGPSLLDEINSMFGSMSAAITQPKSPDFEQTNKKNEFTEFSTKLNRKVGGIGDTNGLKFGTTATTTTSTTSKKKTAGTVKPISVKDEKILNQAIEIVNEIGARSMNDLVSDQTTTAHSPKRKFSFRFPHLTNNGTSEKTNGNNTPTAGGISNGNTPFGLLSPYSKKKNFTDELKSIPDLQSIIGEEGREAYNSLIERKTILGVNLGLSPAANLLRHLDTNEFEKTTAKTLPRRSMQFNKENQLFGFDDTILSSIIRQHSHDPTMTAATATSATNQQLATIPLHQAPRPMTLPNRSFTKRVRHSELISMPFDNLNAFKFNAAVTSNYSTDNNNVAEGIDVMLPCESPSYVSNTSYKFPEQQTTNNEQQQQQNDEKVLTAADVADAADADDANPIPLPPREGKKHIKANPKRHVRKYPLIIPANGVQRTLNKVTEFTAQSATTQQNGNGCVGGATPNFQVVASIRPNAIKSEISNATAVAAAKSQVTQSNKNSKIISNNDNKDNNTYITDNADTHTYENLDKHTKENCTDSASLHFESIMEADFNMGNVLQSPDVTDGFYNFSIQKEQYNKSKEVVEFDANKISGLYVNEDELRNLDIERNLKLAAQLAATIHTTRTTTAVVMTTSTTTITKTPTNAITTTTTTTTAAAAATATNSTTTTATKTETTSTISSTNATTSSTSSLSTISSSSASIVSGASMIATSISNTNTNICHSIATTTTTSEIPTTSNANATTTTTNNKQHESFGNMTEILTTATTATTTTTATDAFTTQSINLRDKTAINNATTTTTTITTTTPIITTKLRKTGNNELADNALFRKVRESVDMAMNKKQTTLTTIPTTTKTTDNSNKRNINANNSNNNNNNNNYNSNNNNNNNNISNHNKFFKLTNNEQTEAEYFAAAATRLANSNSVSCEDLLEFSDKKPKGCERGVDSDEVRIMTKVLGKDCTPERCLSALESIKWDVHKAIKIVKLQNILPARELNFLQAIEHLQKYEWNLHITALKMRSLKT